MGKDEGAGLSFGKLLCQREDSGEVFGCCCVGNSVERVSEKTENNEGVVCCVKHGFLSLPLWAVKVLFGTVCAWLFLALVLIITEFSSALTLDFCDYFKKSLECFLVEIY